MCLTQTQKKAEGKIVNEKVEDVELLVAEKRKNRNPGNGLVGYASTLYHTKKEQYEYFKTNSTQCVTRIPIIEETRD